MVSSSKSKVYFFYEVPLALKERTRLKAFIQNIFKQEKKGLKSLNYVFCSDKRLLDINRQFLQHDFYTDIVTFELSPKGQPVEGEIYISIDRVRENAKNLKLPFIKELYRVAFHGALHLCGYKDKTAVEIKKIRHKEDFYLNRYSST